MLSISDLHQETPLIENDNCHFLWEVAFCGYIKEKITDTLIHILAVIVERILGL